MTTVLEAPRRETVHRPSGRAVLREAPNTGHSGLFNKNIEFSPGLPYESWQEVKLESSAGRALSAEEERLLFRQMNLAYFQAAQLRDAAHVGIDLDSAAAEFQRLIRRAEGIRDELLRAFHKLNLSIAGRFTNRLNNFDELVSEGQFTLLRAISRFDPERGFRFSTYAMHAIRRRLLRFVRKRHKERQAAHAWTDETAPSSDRRWTLAYQQRVSAATAVVERLLSNLAPRERYVIRSRFGWGQEFEPRTLREIAEELGVSRERVRQLEGRGLRKLRSLAAELDVDVRR